MRMRVRLLALVIVSAAAVVGLTACAQLTDLFGPKPEEQADWKLEATGARIIGGYGDNFAYDGANVRPIEGTAEITIDVENQRVQATHIIRTTPESGPIQISEDESLQGEIKIVMDLNPAERVAEHFYIHGDTGNGPPVMPKIYSFVSAWGPVKIFVDGQLRYELDGHIMYTERARRPDNTIRKDDGTIYSPELKAEDGFVIPGEEYHVVVHSTDPDPDNFPPNTQWIHLNFSEVSVLKLTPRP